ncbi:GET complex subunit get1 [Thelotrema lepadinum]|nr:GET complex subunit get1 [Thelotrema lepadinum]
MATNLLPLIFALQLLIHLANTVGASAINDALWSLYTSLPTTSTSSDFTQLRKLRKEVLRLKTELNATSAQDEFAKWAKLQRQHDKAVGEHDKKSQSLQSFRTSFTTFLTTLRWIATNGVIWLLQFWYGKEPMFWLARGWVPWGVEWVLSFPRAPMGSVSIQIWCMACATVVKMIGAAAVAGWGLWLAQRAGRMGKGEKVTMGAGGGTAGGGRGEGGEGDKKEL